MTKENPKTGAARNTMKQKSRERNIGARTAKNGPALFFYFGG